MTERLRPLGVLAAARRIVAPYARDMTLFSRMHRRPLNFVAPISTAWIATGLGLTSILLARWAARLTPANARC